MRSSTLTRTLVGITAAATIAAGGLAGATSSFAAAPASRAVASTKLVVPLATVNLGLSTTQAGYVQCWLTEYWGYTDGIDGQLGTLSWEAFQRGLKADWGYTGAIDGVVGGGTVSALQRLLKTYWGYTGAIDGEAGAGTQAAFKRFANADAGNC